MKEMPVNKLMVQMGIPMILSMALQAVYNIVDSAFVGNMKEGSEAALNALTLISYTLFHGIIKLKRATKLDLRPFATRLKIIIFLFF